MGRIKKKARGGEHFGKGKRNKIEQAFGERQLRNGTKS